MKCSTQCLFCFLKKQEQFLLHADVTEEAKRDYLCALLKMFGEEAPFCSAPRLMEKMNALRSEILHLDEDMTAEKRFFNGFMLEREELFRNEITSSDDPLRTVLLLSRTGNYIDFSAVENVTDEKLLDLLTRSKSSSLDENTLQQLRNDLASARKLVFCTDNCGEIVLDKLLIETIRKLFPALQVTVMVRGGAVINDAAMEDAEQVGLDRIAPVIGSGCAAPGTDIEIVSPEAGAALGSADLIIAKGQGNFEGLSGCGLNVYYLFLCKCDLFVHRFGLPQFEGVFAREQALFPENNA